MSEWIDGEIPLDSEPAQVLGFTSDLFEGYLWKTGDSIIVSSIESKERGKGNFSRLVATILERGFTVKVPTPFAYMQAILERWGFEQTAEWSDTFQEHCEVWRKEPLP